MACSFLGIFIASLFLFYIVHFGGIITAIDSKTLFIVSDTIRQEIFC